MVRQSNYTVEILYVPQVRSRKSTARGMSFGDLWTATEGRILD